MTVLMVDDEILAIRALRSMADWKSYGFNKIYEAMNLADAQRIIQTVSVDLIFCDVELQNENGLDLLKWLRQNNLQTLCLLLTCHAEFGYAKQAIEYKVYRYLLKPIDRATLNDVLRDVQALLQRRNAASQKDEGLLRKMRRMQAENFWRDLVEMRVPDEEALIREELEDRQLDFPFSQPMTLVLFKIRCWEHITQKTEKSRVRENIVARVTAYFHLKKPEEMPFTLRKDKIVLALWNCAPARLDKDMDCLCQDIYYWLGVKVCSYTRESCKLVQTAEALEELEELDRLNVTQDQGYFNLRADTDSSMLNEVFQQRLLSSLRRGENQQTVALIRNQLHEMAANGQLQRNHLISMSHVFQSVLYQWLAECGLSGKLDAAVFAVNDGYEKRFDAPENLCRAIMQQLEYISHARVPETKNKNVVRCVKEYIAAHYSEDITRQDLATASCLQRDYLSRIFKQETGKTLAGYLLEKRMEIACGLLTETSLPIGTIASDVGFANLAHFSRAFGRIYHMTPSGYRTEHGKKY